MKILLIDDNQLIFDSVKSRLAPTYVVDSADTGYEGIERARLIRYGLILLDLGLPDMDGFEVCRALRSANVGAPILILTVRKDSATSVRLLNCGADDFLTKPFNGDELRARIAALLRRSSEMHEEKIIKVSDLTMNVTRRQVTRSGTIISLRRKEFDILEYLISNQGHALTRSMILDHVWEAGTEGWNNTVDVHIKHLRDKVDRPFGMPLIKTAYGIGYMVDDT
ncbi:MAG TPA: response regulator transcription factor [Candidatus Saccharimonadia bacterium]|nr:response regulator transcription factor [Candidatus Saccharimonadia bacterium]